MTQVLPFLLCKFSRWWSWRWMGGFVVLLRCGGSHRCRRPLQWL